MRWIASRCRRLGSQRCSRSAMAGRQALDLGRAVALNGTALAQLGEAIEAQLGRAVRAELTVFAANARVHPALKRGLGLARACLIESFRV